MLCGHSEFLYSKEGITSGDPLSMFVYAVATLPLIRMLSDTAKWIQMWYADDTSAGGLLSDLYDWFTLLHSCSPAFGFVRKFAAIASSQLQAAFAAVTKSIQCEWTFLMRVAPSCGPLLVELGNSFSSCLLPALFGVEVSANERQLFALPSKFGGVVFVIQWIMLVFVWSLQCNLQLT